MQKSILLTVLILQCGTAKAEEPAKNDVFVNQGSIVLMEDDQITKFITPRALIEHGRFEIRIKRPKDIVVKEAPVSAPSLSDRIEARRIMHEANQAYFSGDISKSWELVAKAEQLDPNFYRIKTMKGSLLYKIGSTDLAQEVWKESLAQNPDQPEIIQTLQAIKNKSGSSPASVARSEDANAKKKASLQ